MPCPRTPAWPPRPVFTEITLLASLLHQSLQNFVCCASTFPQPFHNILEDVRCHNLLATHHSRPTNCPNKCCFLQYPRDGYLAQRNNVQKLSPKFREPGGSLAVQLRPEPYRAAEANLLEATPRSASARAA